jgi:hypothetical protein
VLSCSAERPRIANVMPSGLEMEVACVVYALSGWSFKLESSSVFIDLLVTCVHACFLLGLFLDSEDEGNMFVRNVRTTLVHNFFLYRKFRIFRRLMVKRTASVA